MTRPAIIAAYRAVLGLLTIAAIGAQISTSMGEGTFAPARFFAFFTVESNLFAAALLLALAARWRSERSRNVDVIRGAAVVYLVVTFFVVIALLSSADLQLAVPWVDFVLHKLVPVVLVIDWLVDPPATRLGIREGALWLVYPAIWVALTLVRGALDGWYPYPFLDPAHGGYGTVLIVSAAILVGFIVIAAATIVLGNALGAKRPEGKASD